MTLINNKIQIRLYTRHRDNSPYWASYEVSFVNIFSRNKLCIMGIHCIKCSLKPIAAFYHFNCVSSHTARTEDEFLLKVHTNEFNGVQQHINSDSCHTKNYITFPHKYYKLCNSAKISSVIKMHINPLKSKSYCTRIKIAHIITTCFQIT